MTAIAVAPNPVKPPAAPPPGSGRAAAPLTTLTPEIIYPDSDGQPMADNTRQFRYIVTIQGGLAALFADRPDVFVAGDLLWYPVEGNNQIRAAPDAMVVFGRPPGDRGSYQQWKEGGLAPQVVFEVLSPGNTVAEMTRKFRFYERYGVEEYYVYDPDRGSLDGWIRRGDDLEDVPDMEGWVSPRLRMRFSLEGSDLVLYRPDGRRFETFLELEQRAEAERQQAQAERQRAEMERQRADTERQQAQAERQRAEMERQRAEIERQRADTERQRAERLAERLRALGVDPDALDVG